MKLLSYTFTRAELLSAVQHHYRVVAEDVIGDCWLGCDVAKNIVDKAVRLHVSPEEFNFDELIEDWSEMMSDDYFSSHPEISDVLVFKEITPCGEVIKEWMASRKK